MNNFSMKKLSIGIIVALGIINVPLATAASDPKVAIKIAPTKGAIGSQKDAKKFVKGVPWTPCIAAETSYRKGPGPGADVVTKITPDAKTTYKDALTFTVTSANVSTANPLYFYLVDPSGESFYGASNFNTLVFKELTDKDAVKKLNGATLLPVTDALTGISPDTDFLSNDAAKAKTITFSLVFDGVTTDPLIQFNNYNFSAAQGTWTAVAFIAPSTLSKEDLLKPEKWLASSIQPFILGTPYYKGYDCTGAEPGAVTAGDTTAPAAHSTAPIAAKGYAAASTITLRFSEAVDATKITLLNLPAASNATPAVARVNPYGTGATIAPSTGTANTFTITLAGTPTLVATDKITIAKANVVDTAGNLAAADIVFTAPAADTTVPAIAGTNPITVTSYTPSTGTITIKFSEAVDASKVIPANLAVSDHILGTGATVAPQTGLADTFVITLGSTSTVAAEDTITITATNVVDAAGNAAAGSVVFTAPALTP